MSAVEQHDCSWTDDELDPWRCPYWMLEAGPRRQHWCAASVGHEGDHCCIHGTRWLNLDEPKPRRRWRDRIRRRQQ